MTPRDARAGVVVVGAGAAGVAAAVQLRAQGYEGSLTMVNGEDVAPYNRTTVNKGLLDGAMSLESVTLPAPSDPATRWIQGDLAVELDVRGRRVRLRSGEWLPYEAVLIATGARPRAIGVPVDPAVSDRVCVLRTAADAARFKLLLKQVRRRRGDDDVRVGVLGAGLLGAETADSLAAASVRVTLVDPDSLPLSRQLGPTVAGWVRQRHERHVRPAFGVVVTDVVSEHDRALLRLSDGGAAAVDLVLVSRGVRPDLGWLAPTALVLSDGIGADDRLRAKAVPRVYVAGDLALVDGPTGPSRIEHWGTASAQGRHAAQSMLHDMVAEPDPGPFTTARSFATRLYGKGITVLGVPSAEDREVVLAGDVRSDAVTIGFVDGRERLQAAAALGSPKQVNRLRPLVTSRDHVTRAVELLEPELEPGLA